MRVRRHTSTNMTKEATTRTNDLVGRLMTSGALAAVLLFKKVRICFHLVRCSGSWSSHRLQSSVKLQLRLRDFWGHQVNGWKVAAVTSFQYLFAICPRRAAHLFTIHLASIYLETPLIARLSSVGFGSFSCR